MPRPYTEKRKNENRKWDAENLDRLSIAAAKGFREEVQTAASKAGESVNKYIISATKMRMDAEKEGKP